MTDLPFEVHAILVNSHMAGMERRWRAIGEAMLLETQDAPGAWDRIRPFMPGSDLVATGSVDGGAVEMNLMSGPLGRGPHDLVPEWAVRVGGAAVIEALDPSPRSIELLELHRERAAHVLATRGEPKGQFFGPTPWAEADEYDLPLPTLLGVHLLVGGMVEHVRIQGFVVQVDAQADPVGHLRRLASWKQRPESRP
jgi:hypothetical protein